MFWINGLIAGLVMGFLSGLLGIGGGTVIVPALFYIFSLTMKEAIGTSLFIMLFASLSGLLIHRQKGQVNLKLGLILGIAGMAGAQLGGFSTIVISDLWLKRLFGILLLFCASQMLIKREGNRKSLSPSSQSSPAMPHISAGVLYGAPYSSHQHPSRGVKPPEIGGGVSFNIPKSIGIGLGAGYLSGLLGLGGAFVMIPAMFIILQVPMKIAIGTSLLAIFLKAISASGYYLWKKEVAIFLGLVIAATSIIGAQFGARATTRLSADRLRKLFVWFLVAIGILMLVK